MPYLPIRRSLLGLGLAMLACSTPARAPARVPSAASASVAAQSQSHCIEDEGSSASKIAGFVVPGLSIPELSGSDPRGQLMDLVSQALAHSRAVGSQRLLTMAAEADLSEAKSERLPSASLSGTFGGLDSSSPGVPSARGRESQLNLSISAPIWDAGRIAKMSEFRAQLADAARYGQRSAEEQVALQTVSLALDRSRYVLQAQVYGQYVRKMSCLVEALNVITQADTGRRSELVQAQKSMGQAELSLDQTLSTLRQTETRLKRFVGDQLPPAAGMSTVLSALPNLEQLRSDIANAPDIAQADAQAHAQRTYAESVLAGQKPTVSVMVNGAAANGVSRSQNWIGGVAVNVPLYQPGANDTLMAAHRRAQAAQMQAEDTLEAKRYRLDELYDSASSALERSHRIVEILRQSDVVRGFTLEQWQQLGRRSLFDVMASEGDYYNMRVAHVNALFDAEQVVALMWSMGQGVTTPLR